MKAETRKTAEWTGALTLAAMSLGFGVAQLDVTIVNTALNAIASSFGGGVSALQWVVMGFLPFSPLSRLAVVAADRFRRLTIVERVGGGFLRRRPLHPWPLGVSPAVLRSCTSRRSP